MIANVGSFVYILVLARLLKPFDYATVFVFVSLLNLLVAPANILQLTVVSLVSEAKGKNTLHQLSGLKTYFLQKLGFTSLIVLLVYLLSQGYINDFLKVNNPIYLLITVATFIAFLFLVLFRSILQGLLHLEAFFASSVLEMVTKVSLVVITSLAGLAVFGALFSYFLCLALTLLFTFWRFSKVKLPKKPSSFESKNVLKIIIPASFLMLGLTSFYTTDVILAKHFLSASSAALYSGLSTLGKIVFFANFGVAASLLPLSTERHSRGNKTSKIFLASLGLVLVICFFFSATYFLFPQYVLLILGRAEYQAAKGLVSLFAIFASLVSLNFLLGTFIFSVRKLSVSYLVFAAAVVQGVGIFFYHSDLAEVILVSIATSFILLLVLAFYTYSFFSKKFQHVNSKI